MRRIVLPAIVMAFLLTSLSFVGFADSLNSDGDSVRVEESANTDDNAAVSNDRTSSLRNKLIQKRKEAQEQLWNEAKAFFEKKDYENAILKLEAILSQDQTSTEARELLEKCRDSLKKNKLEQLWKDIDDLVEKADYRKAILKLHEILTLDETSKEAMEILKECQKNLAQQWQGTKAGERKVVTVNDVEFAFRWCPAGTFMMGSPTMEPGRHGDEKQHEVTLTKGFWMLETEVTEKQWKAVFGCLPKSGVAFNYSVKGDDYPVVCVNWNDCQEFCKKCQQLGMPVQFPTEAQWEYACRAGSTTAFFWGNNYDEKKVNCNDFLSGRMKTRDMTGVTRVDKYQPNAWGLYDMHGNVSEWCADWYGEYPKGSVTDPVGPSSGSERVVRGGPFNCFADRCRSASRIKHDPDDKFSDGGFRCVLTITNPEK